MRKLFFGHCITVKERQKCRKLSGKHPILHVLRKKKLSLLCMCKVDIKSSIPHVEKLRNCTIILQKAV